MDQFIVSTDDRPFAYLQCYDLTAPEYWFRRSSAAARAASTSSSASRTWSIAATDRRSFAASSTRLLATGAPRVITDPDPANARAIRAYEKAGFFKRPHGGYPGRPGAADGAQPMTLERTAPTAPGLSTLHWSLIAAGLLALQADAPVCDGPAADLRLRLCQAVARRGAELGKFAAHRRLVHVLARHARFPVLWRGLAGVAEGLPGRRA